MEYSKEDINKKINQIIKDVDNDKKEIEETATKKDFYITISETREIEKRLHKTFKTFKLKNISFNWDSKNNYKNLTNDIFYSEENKEYLFLNKIGFKDIDLKNKTITLRTDSLYYLYLLKDIFNIDYVHEVIKTFMNGKTVIKFTEEKVFDSFKEIVYFNNEETEKVLNAITEVDIKKYSENKLKKYMNLYSVIHDIKERLNLSNWVYINYFVVIKEIDKRACLK